MALQRQLKRFPAVLLPARLMELLPASGFRIRSGKLPVRTGATEIVNVNERSLRTVVSAITLRNPIATSCESATRARGRVLQGHRVGTLQDAPRKNTDAQRHDARPTRR